MMLLNFVTTDPDQYLIAEISAMNSPAAILDSVICSVAVPLRTRLTKAI